MGNFEAGNVTMTTILGAKLERHRRSSALVQNFTTNGKAAMSTLEDD